MAVDPAEFVSAMRQFSAAVNIITTGSGEARAGLTATAVISLTAEPPQVAVAVNRSASAYGQILANGSFCINTLAVGHEDVARRFAGAAKGSARFEGAAWDGLATGSPVLADALISLDCVTNQVVEFSTHSLFVGGVAGIRRGNSSKPLLFVDGQWAGLLPATTADLDHVADFVRHSIQTADEADTASDGTMASFDDFVRNFTKLNLSEQGTSRKHLSSELYAPPELLSSLNELKRQFDLKVFDIIRQGTENGTFRVRDPQVTAFALIGMIVWTYKWFRPDGRLSADQTADLLVSLAHRLVGGDDAAGAAS